MDTSIKDKIWARQCPKCNKKLQYKYFTNYQFANKHQKVCRSCSQKFRTSTKEYCNLTTEQKSIMVGMLLGDASFSRNNKISRMAGMQNQHSKRQKDYAMWKADLLKNLYSSHKEKKRFDKRTNKIYESITVVYKSHPFCEKLYQLMKQTDKKIVTRAVLDLLTPVGVAIWYCDDGNIYDNGDINHLTLATNGFKDNLDEILNFFKLNFNINFKKQKDGSIRITSQIEIIKFMKIVIPYIPNCMKYKIWSRY